MQGNYQYIGIVKNAANQTIARISSYSMEGFEEQIYKLEDAERKDKAEVQQMVDDLDEEQVKKVKALLKRKFKI